MKRVPRVRITSPIVTTRGVVSDTTHIEIDGEDWDNVVSYAITGVVGDVQKITLTFIADVTVEHATADKDAA